MKNGSPNRKRKRNPYRIGSEMKFTRRPVFIALAYLVLSFTWIIWSDYIAAALFGHNLMELTEVEMIKGSFFVLVSALLIYYLTTRLYNALVERNDELDILVSQSDMGIIKLDHDLRIEYLTESIRDLLGYSMAETEGVGIAHLIHPEDKATVLIPLEQALSGKLKNFSAEVRLLNNEGHHVWFDVNFTVKIDRGEVSSILASAKDITHIRESRQIIDQQLQEKLALINSTSDLIWSVDKDMNVISYNETFKNNVLRGLDPNSAKFSDLVYKAYGEEEFSKWNRYFIRGLNGETFSVQEVTEYNGNKIYYQTNFNPIMENGVIIGVSCFSRDVTPLRVQRLKVQESEQFLEAILNTAKIGLAIVDSDGNIQRVNKAILDILGYSEEEMIGNHSTMVLFPEEREEAFASFKERVSGPVDQKSVSSMRRFMRADGSEVKVLSSSNILDIRGSRYQVYSVLDLTEKLEYDRQISEWESYLSEILQNASDGIISCDLDGKIKHVNDRIQAWIGQIEEGSNATDIPEKHDLYTIDGDRKLLGEEFSLIKALNEGEIKEDISMWKGANGTHRLLEANGSALYNNTNEKIGAMVLIRDITDRVERDTQLANSILNAIEKERNQIASELHDNVVQLMSIANMNLKNLSLDYPDLNNSVKYERSLKHLVEAIDFTRSIAHHIMPRSIEDFGLVPAVQELIENVRDKVNIEFVTDSEFRFNANTELQIYRIIQEGVNNILTHSKAKSAVVRLNLSEDNVLRVEIVDDGVGFDPNNHQNIGIGLQSMRNRARDIGGLLTIRSGENGTRITLKANVSPVKNGQ